MSTRACYTFKDRFGAHHVYKHHDGYPDGAKKFIAKALPLAWPLPRFEADEFAAAFVAGNKPDGEYSAGGVRLTHDWQDHDDLKYRYEISHDGKNLCVRAFSVYGDKEIFSGSFTEFQAWEEPEEE